MIKLDKKIKIAISLAVVFILLLAWSPWLTEDYGKAKVLGYFNQEYGLDKNEIIITSVEKKPFEIHFGLSIQGSENPSGQQTSVHTWVTFYGKVNHDKFMTTT